MISGSLERLTGVPKDVFVSWTNGPSCFWKLERLTRVLKAVLFVWKTGTWDF